MQACIKARLVDGEGFAIDASVIEADASRFHPVEGDHQFDRADPKQMTRPVREYLTVLDAAAASSNPADWIKTPKALSVTDPLAAWTTKGRMRVCFAYAANYLIDLKTAVIVDVEPTPARMLAEVESTKTMLARTAARFHLKPDRLAADTAYGSARNRQQGRR